MHAGIMHTFVRDLTSCFFALAFYWRKMKNTDGGEDKFGRKQKIEKDRSSSKTMDIIDPYSNIAEIYNMSWEMNQGSESSLLSALFH